jgi:hypothetical protein
MDTVVQDVKKFLAFYGYVAVVTVFSGPNVGLLASRTKAE